MINNYMVQRFYKIIRISSYEVETLRGNKKKLHDFENVFKACTFDDCIKYLQHTDDGYFRVTCRTSKKFLFSLNCQVVDGCVFF